MTSSPDPLADRHARVTALLDSIAHTGPIATACVTLPPEGPTLTVSRPTDADLLLDQSAADPEQNLPYWCEIWPSGLALAAAIARHPERIAGRRVLELGCGLGITAAVAVQHGAHLTATDYAAEALTLTRVTTLRHTGREPDRLQQLNWRQADTAALVREGGFDVVLAADVLYERRDIAPLLAATEALLAPGGAWWLAEPGREPAQDFLRTLDERGWTDTPARWTGPWPDRNARAVVHTHWLTRRP